MVASIVDAAFAARQGVNAPPQAGLRIPVGRQYDAVRMIGTVVGHYRITSRIGGGGMGVVYLAHDQRLDRLVALKFLRSGAAADGAHQLLREARAASALNHPGICTVHEVGESGEDAYIVMEFAEGETLADRIARGPLTPNQVAAIGGDIASALAHAHARGVVHRDLKSANIVLGPTDRVKVLDFGLSRRTTASDDATTRAPDTGSASAVLAGTPAYMSPEVLRGEPADERADLWALGVTLYEMCSGRRPFQGATIFDLAAAVLGDDPPALPALVPTTLAGVVMRALSRDPAWRFESAAALRDALAMAARHGAAVGGAALTTLAVLPFENLSRDDTQEFFVDGMTEAITVAVARLGAVRVISRTSAMQFKRDRPPLPDIARRLGTDAVVEGSVTWSGRGVRVTARLVDARADELLWSDSLDRDLKDVLALQDDVARAIVAGIHGRLTSTGGGRPPAAPVATASQASPAESRRRPVNPDAYVEYLRGQHAWTRRTVPALRQAIASYERAIDLDPTYALAYAGIAECYGVLGFMGALAPRNAYAPARAAAKRAITLDRSVGAAFIALGYAATHDRWELDAAAAAFDEGLRLAPEDMNARHWYALLLTSRGDRDGAVAQMRLAIELDPLATIARTAMGLILYFFGEFEAAAAECRDALDLRPGYAAAEWTIGKILLASGDIAGALRILRPLSEASSWMPVLADTGRALGLAGARDEALAVLHEMRALSAHTYVRPYDMALVHLGLGDDTAALDELDRAFDDGGNWLNYLHLDRAFARLHGQPRFTALLARTAASREAAPPPS